MTVRQSPVATLVGRERNSAKRIADPAGLAASEHDGVTRNGERQVGIEVMGLDPNQRFTTQRFDIDGSDHLRSPLEVWRVPGHRCRNDLRKYNDFQLVSMLGFLTHAPVPGASTKVRLRYVDHADGS